MSLINDALKKAQKQRTGEAPSLGSMPSVGGESAHQIARRSKPAGFNTLMVRAGIAGAVVLVVAAGAFFALREKPDDRGQKTEVSSAKSSSEAPVSSPAPTSSSAVRSPSSETPAAPVFTLPVAPKTETPAQKSPAAPTAVASAPSTAAKQPSTVSSAPVSQPATPVVEPPKPAPKLSAHAIEFIENIKVAGIRASATDPKVLMNDRVYRPGSVVSADLGLKLVEIGTNSLTFEDDKGGRYTRTF